MKRLALGIIGLAFVMMSPPSKAAGQPAPKLCQVSTEFRYPSTEYLIDRVFEELSEATPCVDGDTLELKYPISFLFGNGYYRDAEKARIEALAFTEIADRLCDARYPVKRLELLTANIVMMSCVYMAVPVRVLNGSSPGGPMPARGPGDPAPKPAWVVITPTDLHRPLPRARAPGDPPAEPGDIDYSFPPGPGTPPRQKP